MQVAISQTTYQNPRYQQAIMDDESYLGVMTIYGDHGPMSVNLESLIQS